MDLRQELYRVASALADAQIGYNLAAGMIPFDTGLLTERRVFRVSRAEGKDFLTLDFILVSPFLEQVWNDRERRIAEDHELKVVSRKGLVFMKKVAGRTQDLADVEQLEINGPEDG